VFHQFHEVPCDGRHRNLGLNPLGASAIKDPHASQPFHVGKGRLDDRLSLLQGLATFIGVAPVDVSLTGFLVSRAVDGSVGSVAT
jgi:hypothetical protein